MSDQPTSPTPGPPDAPGDPPPPAAPKGSNPQAESAAAAALAAAQAAVDALRSDTGETEPAAESPTPVAAAPSAPAAGATSGAADAAAFKLPDFTPASAAEASSGIDLLADVMLNVKIELGRTRMLVEDILQLGSGSVVELDKPAGDPVDIFVNDRPIARGEVLVLNDNFCVRINEILSPQADV